MENLHQIAAGERRKLAIQCVDNLASSRSLRINERPRVAVGDIPNADCLISGPGSETTKVLSHCDGRERTDVPLKRHRLFTVPGTPGPDDPRSAGSQE